MISYVNLWEYNWYYSSVDKHMTSYDYRLCIMYIYIYYIVSEYIERFMLGLEGHICRKRRKRLFSTEVKWNIHKYEEKPILSLHFFPAKQFWDTWTCANCMMCVNSWGRWTQRKMPTACLFMAPSKWPWRLLPAKGVNSTKNMFFWCGNRGWYHVLIFYITQILGICYLQ